MSFSKYENEYVKLLNGSDPEVSRTTIIYERELQIDNKDAFQFGLVTQQENVGLGAIITLIRNGSDMFVLTGMAINEPRGEFIKYKGLFELIASTVKFY